MSNRPKGNYMPHQVPGLAPRRPIPRYNRNHKPEISDGCMVVGILFFSMLFALTATKCTGQTRFDFVGKYATFHEEGATADYQRGVHVHAHGDTLTVDLPGCPVEITGMADWVWTDSGVMYCNTLNAKAKYTPGKWPELWLRVGALNITISTAKPTDRL